MVTGMRDFLPKEKLKREQVLSTIRSSYRNYGFDEIETPALEDVSRLRSSDGGDNTKMTFEVLKRRLKPEQWQQTNLTYDLVDLGLRFDLTVPLSRFYEDNKTKLPEVFRSIQIAPVWRAERPQKGRYRQFIQCDIDIIGDASMYAEVELITVTASTLKTLGVTDFTVRMNDRQLLNSFLDSNNVPTDLQRSVLILLDKMDKIPADKMAVEFTKLGLDESTYENILRLYALDDDSSLSSIITAVNEIMGEEVAVFDPTLVRGMGYYTGTIFEVAVPNESYSLGGGGRYDDMLGLPVGPKTPAVGFSLGFERIIDLVKPLETEKQTEVALLYTENSAKNVQLSRKLVEEGYRVKLIRKANNTRRQLDLLSAEGFNLFAFVDNVEEPTVELRAFQK
jgi:histidyl-tRNA synthetase